MVMTISNGVPGMKGWRSWHCSGPHCPPMVAVQHHLPLRPKWGFKCSTRSAPPLPHSPGSHGTCNGGGHIHPCIPPAPHHQQPSTPCIPLTRLAPNLRGHAAPPNLSPIPQAVPMSPPFPPVSLILLHFPHNPSMSTISPRVPHISSYPCIQEGAHAHAMGQQTHTHPPGSLYLSA